LNVFDTNGVFQGPLNLSCTVGNVSFDPTREVFWAWDIFPNSDLQVATSAPVWTIDPATGQCNFEFDALPLMNANGACGGVCHWPADGLDYDERDDTIRLSPDASSILYNVSPVGAFVSLIPITTVVQCGIDFNSGVATGASNVVYTASGPCTEVFKWDKDSGLLINSFPIAANRNEGMACDSVTFANQGTDAIWVKDLNGFIQSFAVPDGTCEITPPPEVKKFYTFTDNNFTDDRCDGDVIEEECVASDGQIIDFRRPNTNLDDDIFADPLPNEGMETFFLQGDEKKKKTVVTPGQYIAVSDVFVPAEQTIWVVEDFSLCLGIGTVNPNKVPGGVQVVLILANGDVFDIDDDLAEGIGGSIVLNPTNAVVHVEDVPAGSTVKVMVKFSPNHDQNMVGLVCTNFENILDEDDKVITSDSAILEIVQK